MTKDCQCHGLFYPTLISSRSSNYVNSLKAKTTVSPVITTLRTIAVVQRKRRKNDDLATRSKLCKSSYNVSHIDSQPGPTSKRTGPRGLFEYDYRQFTQGIFLSAKSQSFSNISVAGLSSDAHKEDKLAEQIANQTELSQASSNSHTCTNIKSDFARRNNRCRNSTYRSYAGKENRDGSLKRSFGAANWKARPVSTENGLSSNSNYSPKIGISEDRDPLIFNMSPFSLTQTLSTFVSWSANHPQNRKTPNAFDHKKTKNDDLEQESEDDEDERLISITSVSPIDIIPQSHKSS
ncbi:hypothetical protein PCANC_20523 [Puccinia coronata f. sp. avenae]|uniref:Uncharacterized protein n=1 Tax=Puccinia coronata f. sp. avenae TaxID=200324 RepID=A0A2N5SA42_9BASI|nr:hypothetical protein PCANC_20523 [Puccinia coronata f. sp. avenae]